MQGGPRFAWSSDREPAGPYVELASLVRYEHVQAALDDEQYRAAMARLEADDRKREHADFGLKDLSGKVDACRSARQGRDGELLGNLVSSLPEGDAGSRYAVRALRAAGAGDSRHLG